MALKGNIKISSVNNLSDARYVAGMGVEYMGFDIRTDSPQCVTPTDFSAITGWVSGVRLVGEVDQINPAQLSELTAEYEIDIVEVKDYHFSDIGGLSLPFALRFDQPDAVLLPDLLSQHSGAEYFLINKDGFASDHWENTLKDLIKHFPIIIGGDLNQQQALEWLELGALGIELKGGDEIKPGYKDFDGLADILEALEIDEAY